MPYKDKNMCFIKFLILLIVITSSLCIFASHPIILNESKCRLIDSKVNQYNLENKIREYVRNGMVALHKENKIGDALRYL